MNISRNSLLYKWAYTFTDSWSKPDQTTLCAFFWRAFLFVPLGFLAMITIGSAFLIEVIITYKENPTDFFLVVGLAVGVVLVAIFVTSIPAIADSISNRLEDSEWVFVKGLTSLKKKFCPIIRFKDQEHNHEGIGSRSTEANRSAGV